MLPWHSDQATNSIVQENGPFAGSRSAEYRLQAVRVCLRHEMLAFGTEITFGVSVVFDEL